MGVTPAVAPTLHSFTLTLLLQEKKGSGGLKVSFSSPSHPHFHPLGTEKEAKCNIVWACWENNNFGDFRKKLPRSVHKVALQIPAEVLAPCFCPSGFDGL